MRFVALFLALITLFACASTKPLPCPPPETVIVKVPVAVCPKPSAITPPVLQLPTLGPGATVQDILAAAEHDMRELERVLAEYEAALEPYR